MFRQVNLPVGVPGMLFLHSMPGRYEALAQFLADITRLRVGRIICLAPLDEIRKKSEHYFQAIQTDDLPCEREPFEIKDYQAPDDPDGFVKLAKAVSDRLRAGERILIHCAGGVGRTGMFAVSVLLALGIELREALTMVNQSGSRPESEGQVELIHWVAGRFKDAHRSEGG